MAKSGTVEVWGIPSCGTTRKAMKFLEAKSVDYTFKNYREVAPGKTLLREAMKSVDAPRKMFNTSGGAYRDGGYKEKAATMSSNEVLEALQDDSMLIKRPIVRTAKGILVGFNEERLTRIL